jgi:hypothetical protein
MRLQSGHRHAVSPRRPEQQPPGKSPGAGTAELLVSRPHGDGLLRDAFGLLRSASGLLRSRSRSAHLPREVAGPDLSGGLFLFRLERNTARPRLAGSFCSALNVTRPGRDSGRFRRRSFRRSPRLLPGRVSIIRRGCEIREWQARTCSHLLPNGQQVQKL